MYKENFIIWASGIFFSSGMLNSQEKNQYHPKKIILVEEKASVHDKKYPETRKRG